MDGWEPKSSQHLLVTRGYAVTPLRLLYCMFNYTLLEVGRYAQRLLLF